ncbi:MAG TPA: class I SAM-dependent methyltransferase [Anaerolineales bacterium]|nr:class I SAM-dependent methyltransferase [Anaerolineales bacterium]
MPESTDLERMRQEYANRKIRLADSKKYSYFNPAYLFAIQQRQRAVLSLLREMGITSLDSLRLLEVGCGSGGVLSEFLIAGTSPPYANGVDLLLDRVKEAHMRHPVLPLACADAQHLPYPNHRFELVVQYTAFSSILDLSVKKRIAREMLRVVKHDHGLILWYDFWLNPTNPQTKGIGIKEIKELFPSCAYHIRRITLAPPLARFVVPISWVAAEILEKFILFNSHYLIAICP